MKNSHFILLLAFSCAGFFASAQDLCDSVFIADIRYDAFEDSILLVEVVNHSGDIFSYPGFILFDAEGDTIAKETVNFFGIGEYQISRLSLFPDAGSPSEVNDGRLELWMLFYDTLVCTFPVSGPLCPDTVCNKLVFSMGNFGGAFTIGDFSFEVRDSLGNTLLNLGFALTDTIQEFADTICLPNGAYSFELSTDDFPTGGQPYFYLYEPGSQYYGSTIGGYFNQGPSLEVPFFLYKKCYEGPSRTEGPDPGVKLTFIYGPDGIWGFASAGKIQEMKLFDMSGRLLHRSQGPAEELFLPAGYLQGMYLVQAILDDGEQVTRLAFFP